MFLPIRDAPNPPGVAVVNYALIAVNVAVFLLITVPLGLQEIDPNDPAAAEFLRQRVELYGRQALQVPASAYDIVVHRYGYRPAEGSALSLLTSMFLHMHNFYHRKTHEQIDANPVMSPHRLCISLLNRLPRPQ